ncbi:aldo/keto reductase [Seongchinamella sediminis]|uniref:Aldo/keto reductase n=1 Tax=Seongchinamella sediminis TaxID=2283635 RepID=A0A3L7E4D1_9GAMM|nr:aldo/keto reductase [Seongchinamella sediminis]RLQ23341.1 aldo/keto reductase [Seongchinamella sediminis]
MISRRDLLAAATSALALAPLLARALPAAGQIITRPIPGSGELLPAIGMGTSRTFDAGADAATIARLADVMQLFFAGGGAVIDSSPMYGEAESRVGDVLRNMDTRPPLFAATKVWTEGREAGIAQMAQSARRMNVDRFDLIAVHNLVDWKTQLATLKAWKSEGKVRYIGITTSHGRYHEELLDIMRREPLDFVQFSYNIGNRTAEQALLPLAADRGIATMINRPFQRGSLFQRSGGAPLPDVGRELGCSSWGQFYLKFILGHPAVTCLIPATSKTHHMADNMGANTGPVPDAAQRAEMLRAFDALPG